MSRRLALAARLAAVLSALLSTPLSPAGELSPERQREIVRDALNSLDAAVNMGAENPARAAQQYRRSAAAFEALADAGIHNVALHYNLGNVYYRLGDLGRAVLNYRRAARIDPSEPRVQSNLRLARNRVMPLIEAPLNTHWFENALTWHAYSPPLTRRVVAWCASAVGAALLMARIRRRSAPLLIGGVAALLLGAAAAASLAWQTLDERGAPAGVIVMGEHVLRVGRGEGYDAALRQPLGAGVELRVLQVQGDWAEVRLMNGVTGWIPASAVERV